MSTKLRTGIGYDVHPLATGRRLVLGGVAVPFDRGLAGWSDGDVLSHAVMDALLGAAALGDIGGHFPPGDPAYKDISSLELLGQVREKLAGGGWQVVNIDATVMAEAPTLSGFIPRMRQEISQALGTSPGRVSVKATTSEGLGLVGRGEGIAALAVALVEGSRDEDL